MKTILLEELDPRTSEWLREASRHEQVLVTAHGKAIMTVTITPEPAAAAKGGSLQGRVLSPAFRAVMNGLGAGGTDSAVAISEDRDREIG
jgi:antitoxin (DNA-binding transcriptional repressor) of toxin-antitoxin stability system